MNTNQLKNTQSIKTTVIDIRKTLGESRTKDGGGEKAKLYLREMGRKKFRVLVQEREIGE